MSTIVTRAGKGLPLTNNEVDANFTNLNTDKLEGITSADGSIDIVQTGTSVDLQVSAQSPASVLLAPVRNETGVTLAKGTMVYISGAAGNKCLVSMAQADSESHSSRTFGMVTANINNNQNGYVTISGIVSGLNTSAYADGTTLYLSPTTPGGYTSTKPSAPSHLVYIGTVTYSHANQGAIQARIQNGYELDELHSVSITSVTDNQFLKYDAASGLWKNNNVTASDVTTALGYDPDAMAIVYAIALG